MNNDEFFDNMKSLLNEYESKIGKSEPKQEQPKTPKKAYLAYEVIDGDPHHIKLISNPFKDAPGDIELALVNALSNAASQTLDIPAAEIKKAMLIDLTSITLKHVFDGR